MQHYPVRHQRGAVSFKLILIAFAVFFVVVVVLIVATAPQAPKTAQNQGAQGTQTGTGQNNTQQSGQEAEKKTETKEAFVPMPDGFRRFTNKKYQFSLAYPEEWGGFKAEESPTSPRLRAETKEVTYLIGSTPVAGQLAVSVYNKSDFQIAVRSTAPILIPETKDGKLGWKVGTPDPADTKYRAGNAYPVPSRENPAGVTIYDFSWLLGGRRQARWLYATESSFVLISVPPLAPATGTNPRENDLVFYKAFAESIRDTITIRTSTSTAD